MSTRLHLSTLEEVFEYANVIKHVYLELLDRRGMTQDERVKRIASCQSQIKEIEKDTPVLAKEGHLDVVQGAMKHRKNLHREIRQLEDNGSTDGTVVNVSRDHRGKINLAVVELRLALDSLEHAWEEKY